MLLDIYEPGETPLPHADERGAAVGIDLGTTNSVVAIARQGRPEALRDAAGRSLIPSVVAYRPQGEPLVGDAAMAQLAANAAGTVSSVKRLMGRGIEDLQVVYVRADGVRLDSPPAVDWVTPNFNTLTTQVEVTLVARVMTANHQGSTVAPNNPRAFVRGTMISTTAVRSALLTLRDNAAGAQVWK